MLATPTPTTPQGFRQSPNSGLIVPEAQSRERQVWTKDEWKLLERCTKLLHGHGIALLMKCRHEACKDSPLEPKRLRDGTFRLRCNHADRVMMKAF